MTSVGWAGIYFLHASCSEEAHEIMYSITFWLFLMMFMNLVP